MLNSKLITRDEIRDYKQISKTFNDDKLNDIIIQVQINELRPLLGEKLFNSILNNVGDYQDLLNGSTYEYKGITYQNYGLKAVLAYYIDAYYKMFGDIISTPFGTVNKLNGGISEPISEGFKKSVYKMNIDSAFNIWLNVQSFIVRTEIVGYDLCKVKVNKFKISKIQ